MTSTFYASAAEILKQCQAADGDLSAILDPEAGFAPRLSRLCKQLSVTLFLSESRYPHVLVMQYRLLEQSGDGTIDIDVSQEEIDLLRLESNTWDLLQTLLPYAIIS